MISSRWGDGEGGLPSRVVISPENSYQLVLSTLPKLLHARSFCCILNEVVDVSDFSGFGGFLT